MSLLAPPVIYELWPQFQSSPHCLPCSKPSSSLHIAIHFLTPLLASQLPQYSKAVAKVKLVKCHRTRAGLSITLLGKAKGNFLPLNSLYCESSSLPLSPLGSHFSKHNSRMVIIQMCRNVSVSPLFSVSFLFSFFVFFFLPPWWCSRLINS